MKATSVLTMAVAVLTPAAALYWFFAPGHPRALSYTPSHPPAEHRITPVSIEEPADAKAPPEPQPPAERQSIHAVDLLTADVWEKAPLLEEAVAQAMADFPGTYSVVVHDLTSGKQWEHNPEARYHPASTIKMPVTLYALEQYRAGKLGWQDLIEYTPADFESPGGGAFETAPFGGLYPVENLVNRALRYSNNVAVNMLGRHLGWNNIRAWTRTIDGELYRRPDSMPEVTALSELGWWLHLHRLSQEDPENAELILQPLRQVAYTGRIGAGLPDGVPYLHKFGSYPPNYHDGGIVFAEKPYILIVLTQGGSIADADRAIARVSAAVYEVLAGPERE